VERSTIGGQQSPRQPAAADTCFTFDKAGEERGGSENGGNKNQENKKRE